MGTGTADRRERLRRGLAYLGVLAAAAASLATSDPTWSVDDAVRGETDTLTVTEPEATRHFSVESSDSHTVRVVGWVHWDVAPAADVLIRISKDDGSPPQESVIHSSDAETVGPGRKSDSYFSVGQHQECSSECTQGYMVTLRMENGAPQEKVELDWAFEVHMMGDGTDPPDGAYATVTED